MNSLLVNRRRSRRLNPKLALGLTLLCCNFAGLSGCIPPTAADPSTGTGGSSSDLVEPGPHEAILYYKRPDASYDGWGLHLWSSDSCSGVKNGTSWDAPLTAAGISADYGAYYRIALNDDASCVNFIVHNGDTKDLGGADMSWRLADLGYRVFTLSGAQYISATPFDKVPLTIDGAKAHWLDANTLVWDAGSAASQWELRYASNANIQIDSKKSRIKGGHAIALSPTNLSDSLKAKYPNLATRPAFSIAGDSDTLKAILQDQLVAVAYDASGELVAATQVQTAGALDAYFAYDGSLGAVADSSGVHFKLWAPSAQKVRLHVFDASKHLLPGFPVSMHAEQGVWRYDGGTNLDRQYYQYEVTVYRPDSGAMSKVMASDPYSLSLSSNGQYSQVVNLDDADLKPAGWDSTSVPVVAKPEDILLYETQIRDFSASDSSVPASERGKYLAFTEAASNGISHLKALQAAGLTHVHLLPAFDFATVNEDPSHVVNLDDPFSKLCQLSATAQQNWSQYCGSQTLRAVLESLDPNSGEAQSLYDSLRGIDSFNWGYDPVHYSTPDGSYASNAEGVQRIREFRAMVKGLSDIGLDTVMDVVFNHTSAAGVDDNSVLDKIVPGYYHRRDPDSGNILHSSCCQDTASEHAMMEKLMVDSLRTWARDYKVAGFRFDIMGFHMRSHILDALAALKAVNPHIYLYGEGWNFGEVANNALGINAVQWNMAGTGVGSFNDRVRDAVRGGGPFDGGTALRQNQGFGNGLYTLPNELNSGSADEKSDLLKRMDWIRVSIAGALRNYAFQTADDSIKAGQQIDYNGQHAGYTLDPQEVINYVSAHDNQTLWDNNQYKIASAVSSADRVRMQVLSLAVPLLSQGIPFLHMGAEMLRSKSMERDSYDSGDWFNAVDFSYQDNSWNRGLPRADKDGGNWDLIRQIIADPQARPSASDILHSRDRVLELMRVRAGSPLFHLSSSAEIGRRLHFYNTGSAQLPGLIAFSLDDGSSAGADLDPANDALMVVINASPQTQTLHTGLSGFALHPVLAASTDAVTASASFNAGDFSVPALTAAVFVQPQSGSQGAGVPVATLSGGSLQVPGSHEVILYYKRDDGDYSGWGLHLWNSDNCQGVASGTDWNNPLQPEAVDAIYGAWFRIPLSTDASCLNFIIHNGDNKDLGGADMQLRFDDLGYRLFTRSGIAAVTNVPLQ